MRGLQPGLQILDRRPLAPLRHRLGIDPKFPAQRRERSLRSLYCCSDGVRGRGAPVTNLAHNASCHSGIGTLLNLPTETIYQAVQQALHVTTTTRQSHKEKSRLGRPTPRPSPARWRWRPWTA